MLPFLILVCLRDVAYVFAGFLDDLAWALLRILVVVVLAEVVVVVSTTIILVVVIVVASTMIVTTTASFTIPVVISRISIILVIV